MQTLTSAEHCARSRETRLVVQCARAFLSGGEDGCLQAALAQPIDQPIDWAAVERKADTHSMMPVVAYVLKQHGGSLVPQGVSERLQKRLRLTAQSNLVLLGEWCRILQAFETAGISVISLKGPALALLAYGNIALREFADLDLLIQPDEVQKAHDVLLREGYWLRYPLSANTDAGFRRSRNCQLDFVNQRGTFIDLHWGVLHEMFSFQLPVDQLFKSAQVEHHEGISFLTLSPEHSALYMCAHGTKHCWLNLRWLCDLACHVQAAQKLDWALCIRSAEAANCDLVLTHSLLLAEQVLGLEMPPLIRNYCEGAKALALADAALSLLFREDGDLGYREALRYHLAFAKGWRDRTHLVFERLFVPDEQDWQQIRLPQSLHMLYYTVRPVRFIFGHLSKGTLESRAEDTVAKKPNWG
jgi:hypothetical protein